MVEELVINTNKINNKTKYSTDILLVDGALHLNFITIMAFRHDNNTWIFNLPFIFLSTFEFDLHVIACVFKTKLNSLSKYS